MFIVAFILVAIFAPLGMLFTTSKTMMLIDKSYFDNYFKNLAISLDQFGNVACGGLFNFTLIQRGSKHKFGNPDETVSSVIGKNKVKNSLSLAGKLLDWVLDKLDANHSIKSIENKNCEL